MNDHPTSAEIIQAVREWLSTTIAPALKSEPALAFQSLIAAHILGIVEREQSLAPELLKEEWHWYQHRLGLSEQPASEDLPEAVERAKRMLCEKIREGAFDEDSIFLELLREIQQSVSRKMRINNV